MLPKQNPFTDDEIFGIDDWGTMLSPLSIQRNSTRFQPPNFNKELLAELGETDFQTSKYLRDTFLGVNEYHAINTSSGAIGTLLMPPQSSAQLGVTESTQSGKPYAFCSLVPLTLEIRAEKGKSH